ncbi:hypothetical protein TPA0910_74850 [Streptomyces hygroscopicus subsp. sporocinereus]|uniref:Uncharacterized protein n=1 Tax=Streptomyces hygroscopicus TaxID=1912 RepID=A0ABQ3UBS1_STRHY|nr:hypothetical protein TPA0910_74850 [Streptomyces hygroscopicus]
MRAPPGVTSGLCLAAGPDVSGCAGLTALTSGPRRVWRPGSAGRERTYGRSRRDTRTGGAGGAHVRAGPEGHTYGRGRRGKGRVGCLLSGRDASSGHDISSGWGRRTGRGVAGHPIIA